MTPVVSRLLRAPTGLGFRFFFSSLRLSKAALQPHSLLNLGHLCRRAEWDASSQDLLLLLDVTTDNKQQFLVILISPDRP